MKTTLHYREFDLSVAADNAAYIALRAAQTRDPKNAFEVWAETGAKGAEFRQKLQDLDGKEVELDTSCLFDNQWNTAAIPGISESGMRVFDFYAERWPNRSIRTVQWLEITDEMRAIRATVRKCGYCGKHYPGPEGLPRFELCTSCVGSEYLKPESFPLLRLKPIDFTGTRAPLTEEETEFLTREHEGAYALAQAARRAKLKERIERDAEKSIRDIGTETSGKTRFLDMGLDVDNLIFYPHTGRFCYGWREKVTREGAERIHAQLTKLAPFRYPLDFDTEAGKIDFAKENA